MFKQQTNVNHHFSIQFALIQCCGDVGSGGILEESDRLESPEAHDFNVRSRRAKSNSRERKACGKDNPEKIPLIRYGNKYKE